MFDRQTYWDASTINPVLASALLDCIFPISLWNIRSLLRSLYISTPYILSTPLEKEWHNFMFVVLIRDAWVYPYFTLRIYYYYIALLLHSKKSNQSTSLLLNLYVLTFQHIQALYNPNFLHQHCSQCPDVYSSCYFV